MRSRFHFFDHPFRIGILFLSWVGCVFPQTLNYWRGVNPNWSDSSNWSLGVVPDSFSVQATFSVPPNSSPPTLTSSISLYGVLFDPGSSNGYTISSIPPTNQIQFSGNESLAILSSSGSNVISSPIQLTQFSMTNQAFFGCLPGSFLTLSGQISELGSSATILVSNGGVVSLTYPANLYSGGTLVSDTAILQVPSDGALGTGPLFLAGGTFQLGSSLSSNRPFEVQSSPSVLSSIDLNGFNFSYTGPITDYGSGSTAPLQVQCSGSSGVFTLGNTQSNNSYSSGTNLVSGTLSVSTDAALGTGELTLSGGIFRAGASFSLNPNRSISLGTAVIDPFGNLLQIQGPISGGSLTIQSSSGTGTIVLSNSSNHYSGGTSVLSGTLRILSDSVLGSGSLNVQGGTLQAGASFTSSRTISIGPANLDSAGYTMTWNGPLNDLAAPGTLLTIQSSASPQGTVVLGDPSNSYSGGTKIVSGTLQISASSSLGSGPLTIQNGTLQAGSSFTLSLAPPISLVSATIDTFNNQLTIGPSTQLTGNALTVISSTGSAGSLLLQNTSNNYSGGTTLVSGTLQIPSDQVLGALTGGVTLSGGIFQATGPISSSRLFTVNSGSMIDTNGKMITLSNSGGPNITGSGPLQIQSSTGSGGIFDISASTQNTYSGGTVLVGGILRIGADGSLGNPKTLTLGGGTTLQAATGSSISLIPNRTLSLSGSATIDVNGTAMQIGGAIKGSGALTLDSSTGGGSLSLTGALSYLGPTTINASTTLSVSSPPVGPIVNSGTLVFALSSPASYGGVISGSGPIAVQGTSPLTLTGGSPAFTGAVTVASGSSLAVNGNLSSSSLMTVNGLLSGIGSVGPSVVSGTIQPGDPGSQILTVNGPLSFNPGGTFLEQLSGQSNALLQVNGVANLTNGQLVVQPLGGFGFFGFSNHYTILEAASISGLFNSLISVTDPAFKPSLVYGSTTVDLILWQSRPFHGFSCGNRNECAVAHNIDALGAAFSVPPDLVNIVNSFAGESDVQVNNALDQMHPAAISALAEVQSGLGGELLALFCRTPSLSCREVKVDRLWVAPFGFFRKENAEGIEIGFRSKTRGIAVGYDTQLLDGLSVGFGGTWNQTDLTWTLDRGYAYVERAMGAFYSDFTVGNFYLGGTLCAGQDWVKTVRQLHFTIVDRQASAHSTALDVEGRLTSAYFFGRPSCLLYPYATVDYLYLKNDSFQESGAFSLNLQVDPYQSHTLRAEAGGALRFIDRNRDNSICISPFLGLGYVLELPLERDLYRARFAGQSILFETEGWQKGWQLLSLQFALTINYHRITCDASYRMEVDPQGNTPLVNQRATFAFRFDF